MDSQKGTINQKLMLEDGRQGKTKETILKNIICLLFIHIQSIES
jgi:hypothetical protein